MEDLVVRDSHAIIRPDETKFKTWQKLSELVQIFTPVSNRIVLVHCKTNHTL